MIDVTIERDKQSLINRFRWHTVASRWAHEVGAMTTEAVKHEAPVSKKPSSGRLRDSISFTTHVSPTQARVEIISHVPYGGYVVHGTPPHIIQPRNASVLHWQDGGNHYYRALVNHPGARANPFPRRAAERVAPLIRTRLRDAVISSMGGKAT
jgi:hypothetical protein